MLLATGLLVSLALVFWVSPVASDAPDGLEKVAEEQGFAEDAREHSLSDAPLSGYQVFGQAGSSGTAGVVGVLLVFGAGYALASLLHRRTG